MKYIYKAWLLLVTVCPAWTLQAAPVDSMTVSKVAAAYLSQYVDHFEGLECVAKRTAVDGTALYYIFNHKNGNGFIMVVADDACFPILGYSPTGRFAPNNVPPQLDKMLFHRASEIRYIKQQRLAPNDEIKQFWQRLKYPPSATRIGKIEAIGPLLTTAWDQGMYYNDACPKEPRAVNDQNGRTLTGCVATAMAQIMKYYSYPRIGQGLHSYIDPNYGLQTANFGSTTYDWASMPSSVIAPNSAVKTLMYHCGVSVDMGYGYSKSDGTGGSGAYPQAIAIAFTKYFGYASSVKYINKKADKYTDASWIAVLKTELDAKRPIQYGGDGGPGSESGHSFVCDGYNNDNLFHFNWGWSGRANNYYYISALNPTEKGYGAGTLGNYSFDQNAIIGIQPATSASASFDLQLNKKIIVSPNPITFGSDITVSFNITNKGAAAFQGDYNAAIFTADGDFVSSIGQTISNTLLPAGKPYTNDLTFTQKSVFLSEGNYKIYIFYNEPQKEFHVIGGAAFENPLQVPVAGVNNVLVMFGTPLQASTSPVYQQTPFSVSCNIANFGTTPFEGDLRMSLFNLDGSFAANIETPNSHTLGVNKTYSSDLVFQTSGLTIPVGTYLLALTYKRKTETSYSVLAASQDTKGTYPNLTRVVVATPLPEADKYEPNNAETQAVTLAVSFVNNVASIITDGSNLHTSNDLDFYKLNLPGGYTYEVTARVHDKANAGNGKTYTADVVFIYKVGNGAYSDLNDVSINEINDKITPSANNTLIFGVGPYFVGGIGTYLLDIQVTRKEIVLGVEPKTSDQYTVYPNPTTGPLTLQAPQSLPFHSVSLMNVLGQKMLEMSNQQSVDKMTLDLSRYPVGMYYLQVTGDTESITRKISVIK